jgi:WD40 repeat protein
VVRLRELVSGRPTDVVLAGHAGELEVLDSLTLHDRTPILVTGGPIRAWEIDTGKPYGPPLPVDLHWRRALASLPLEEGPLLAILLDDHNNLRAWDLRTSRPHGPRLTSAAEAPEVDSVAATRLRDGTPIAVFGTPNALQAWDLAAGRPHGQPLGTSIVPTALACAQLPDDTTLAAAGGTGQPDDNGVVELWNLDDGQLLHTIHVPDPVFDLSFTTEHRLIVRTYLDIAVYDLS